MISAVNNSPNFTGVVPVRVFVDGRQTFDEKLIKSATRKLTSALIKPQENPNLTELFSKFDPQYKKGGYPQDARPSDFFRLIIDRYRGTFLTTGQQTERLNELGKDIGKEKALCRERRTAESLDLIVAKRKYFDVISAFLSSAQLRLRDVNNNLRPVVLNIYMKGKKLENILFTT